MHPGDLIGFYFPNRNPIPYNSFKCLEDSDRFLFKKEPKLVTEESIFQFQKVALSQDPCREFSIKVIMSKYLLLLDWKLLNLYNLHILLFEIQ